MVAGYLPARADSRKKKIIDAEMFNDRSAAVNIRSVPTLVVDETFRATGRVELAEVLEYLQRRRPSALGAMVVLEELAELKPGLADTALDSLWSRFDRVSNHIKGDILYMMGETGGSNAFDRIASIKGSRYDAEVCEAAIDALQALKDRRRLGDQ